MPIVLADSGLLMLQVVLVDITAERRINKQTSCQPDNQTVASSRPPFIAKCLRQALREQNEQCNVNVEKLKCILIGDMRGGKRDESTRLMHADGLIC